MIAYRVGLTTCFVAMLTSLLEPLLSFALYLLIAAYFLIPRGAGADLVQESRRTAGPSNGGPQQLTPGTNPN